MVVFFFLLLPWCCINNDVTGCGVRIAARHTWYVYEDQCHKDSNNAGQVKAGDFKSRSKSNANVTEFSYSPLDTNRTAVLPQYTSSLWLAVTNSSGSILWLDMLLLVWWWGGEQSKRLSLVSTRRKKKKKEETVSHWEIHLQGIESIPQKSPAISMWAGSNPSPPLISTKSLAPSPRHYNKDKKRWMSDWARSSHTNKQCRLLY